MAVKGAKVMLKCRLSYAWLLAPRKENDGTSKYSASLLLQKSDKEQLKKLAEALTVAAAEGKSEWPSKWPNKPKNTLKDGDKLDKPQEAAAGCLVLGTTSKNPPTLLDKFKQDTVSDKDIYSGVEGYALITIKPYYVAEKGSIGITAYINGFMSLGKGDALAGAGNVRAEFDELDLGFTEEDADDLAGLL